MGEAMSQVAARPQSITREPAEPAPPPVPDGLPPGPRAPAAVQTLAWWSRTIPLLERCRRTYGPRFTLNLLRTPPFVQLSDPEEIKQAFMADPAVLHPGEGAAVLEPVVGVNSVILLDEQPHLEQRKLLLPAFHGESVQALCGLMAELTERELDSWPRDREIALHPRFQRLTLEIILRTVFGLDDGERLEELRQRLTRILRFGTNPLSLLPLPERALALFAPAREFAEAMAHADELVFALIEERRRAAQGPAGDAADSPHRDDVLALLLQARHEDGSPMDDQEIRDELMTMLVAGHETTASELAWAVHALLRNPGPLRRLRAEVDADGEDGAGGGGDAAESGPAGERDAYLTATVQETLRRRPVLPNAEPRLVKEPVTIGPWTYPPGAALVASAYLVHHDAAVYPDPYAFRPERFLEQPPGTYTWLPFGGGRRRCLGASFATVEMKVVLRALLRRFELRPGQGGVEFTRRRAITLSPRRGSPAVLLDRLRTGRAPQPAPLAA